MMRLQTAIAILAVAGLALAACGGSQSESASSDCAEGSQVTRIQALDSLRFDPVSVTVTAGEPVCFVITNPGHTEHEFVIGDKAMQEKHEKEMASGKGMEHGMEMEMPELTLVPGETESLTTTFEEPGETMYACHEPGHYPGGMVGTITITS